MRGQCNYDATIMCPRPDGTCCLKKRTHLSREESSNILDTYNIKKCTLVETSKQTKRSLATVKRVLREPEKYLERE